MVEEGGKCAAESASWTISRWHGQGGMVTEGGAYIAGHPKGWILLKVFLGSVRLRTAEHPYGRYSTASPTT